MKHPPGSAAKRAAKKSGGTIGPAGAALLA